MIRTPTRSRSLTLLLALLLLPALGGAARGAEIKPFDKEVLAMARAQQGERWYGIYVLGKKVGWQRDDWREEDGLMCNRVEFTLKLAFLGKVSTIHSRERSCYDLESPFALATYHSTKDEDGRLITIDGRRSDEQLKFRVTTGARPREYELPLTADSLIHAVGWAPLARMAADDTIPSQALDELTGKIRWQRYTLQGREEKLLRGKKQSVFKVLIEDETGMKLDALIDSTGIILEGAMGPSIRIVLEDKKSAMRQDLDLLDLYSTATIEAKGDLDYKRVTRIRRVKLKLAGDGPLDLAPTQRQKVVERGDGFVVVDITSCPAVRQNPPAPKAEFTRCHADIPCDDEEYRKLVAEETKDLEKPLAKALALTRWVNANFHYSLASGGGTGDQVLKSRKGDCTEYSKALITLLRTAGIPARQLSGVVVASDTPPSFGYHAWVEAWVNGLGWVQLDPTWGAYPVDAAHLVFDVNEGLQMASHLGGLTIELLEVEYDEGKDGGITCD